MKLADDVASLNPNIGSLNYDVDLNDTENCLHSEKIQSMPEEKGFAKYSADGKFDVAQNVWRKPRRFRRKPVVPLCARPRLFW